MKVRNETLDDLEVETASVETFATTDMDLKENSNGNDDIESENIEFTSSSNSIMETVSNIDIPSQQLPSPSSFSTPIKSNIRNDGCSNESERVDFVPLNPQTPKVSDFIDSNDTNIMQAYIGTNDDRSETETVATFGTMATSYSEATIPRSNLRPLARTEFESTTSRFLQMEPSSCSLYLSLGSKHFGKISSEQVNCAFERGNRHKNKIENRNKDGLLDRITMMNTSASTHSITNVLNNERKSTSDNEKENRSDDASCLNKTLDFVQIDGLDVATSEEQLTAMQDIATEYFEKKEYDRALQKYEEIVSICRKSPPTSQNGLMGDTLHSIGLIYLEHTIQYEKAIPYFKKAKEVRALCRGDEHIDVMRSIYKLGITQYALEKYDMALSALKNALDRSTVIVGSAHFIVAEILNNLGCVHYRMGDLKGSAELFQKSFLIQKNLLRDELYCDYDDEQENERNLFLVNIATTGSNIGLIKIILGELEESVGLLESALLNQTLVLEGDDVLILSTMENLGAANFYDPPKSLKMYTKLLRIVMKVHGQNHLLCAKIWSKMGRIHIQTHNHIRARECMSHVFACYRKNCMDGDPNYVKEFDQLVKEDSMLDNKLDMIQASPKISRSMRMASF